MPFNCFYCEEPCKDVVDTELPTCPGHMDMRLLQSKDVKLERAIEARTSQIRKSRAASIEALVENEGK